MVLNSRLIGRVAVVSADLCQYIACNPDRFSPEYVLYLLFCFPFQQLRRAARRASVFFSSASRSDDSDSHSD